MLTHEERVLIYTAMRLLAKAVERVEMREYTRVTAADGSEVYALNREASDTRGRIDAISDDAWCLLAEQNGARRPRSAACTRTLRAFNVLAPRATVQP